MVRIRQNLELKAEIIRQGHTLKSFAEIIGMDSSVFNRKINGKKSFKEEEIFVISNALKVDANKIFCVSNCKNSNLEV